MWHSVQRFRIAASVMLRGPLRLIAVACSDYAERLSIGQSVCETLTTTALLNLSLGQPSDSLVQCRLLNEVCYSASYCVSSQSELLF